MTFSTRSTANDNGESALMAAVVNAVHRVVDATVGTEADFATREVSALAVANEAVRQFLMGQLQAIADAQGDQVRIDGALYRRHSTGEVTYHSLCGPLPIRRSTYRLTGLRNGPTRVPVELIARLAEHTTPALAYCIAQGYAKAPMRSLDEDLRAAHRVPPSRSTLERIAKALGTTAKDHVWRIEQVLRAGEHLPDGAVAISLGLDRTSIPMEEARTDDEGPPRRRRTPRIRVAPPPVTVHYRMAYVGTVSVTNAEGEVLVARRYAVPAHDGPKEVVARMMADLDRALVQNAGLHVGVVQDNAPEMWNLMREALRSQPRVGKVHEVVDRYHFMQRLSAALEVVEPDAQERRNQLARWRKALDRNDRTIHRIRKYFALDGRLRFTRRVPDFETMRAIDNIIGGYVIRYEHFQYAAVAKLGLPTGSGVTEGACKSLIAARAKRSGQRWRARGISAVLALRSLLESARLPPFWNHFASRYAANCEAA
jgi:hypothetical protein